MTDQNVLSFLYKGTISKHELEWDSMCTYPLYNLITAEDIDYIRKLILSPRYSGNNKLKMEKIDEVMHFRGFTRLAGGTNRLVYTHPYASNAVFKVAIDSVGINDNPAEFKNQHYLKPYCTKVFECSPCGTIASFEKVDRFTNFDEFYSIADDYYYLITRIILGKYVMEDIGIDYWMNFGLRTSGLDKKFCGPVILDFPYLFELDGRKLECLNDPNNDGNICHGEIDYDSGFNKLICKKCGRTYRARDLARTSDGSGILLRQKGGRRMKLEITRGDKVIKTYDTTVERDYLSKNDTDTMSSPYEVSVTKETKVIKKNPIKADLKKQIQEAAAKKAEAPKQTVQIKTKEVSIDLGKDLATLVEEKKMDSVLSVSLDTVKVQIKGKKKFKQAPKRETIAKAAAAKQSTPKAPIKVVTVEVSPIIPSGIVKAEKPAKTTPTITLIKPEDVMKKEEPKEEPKTEEAKVEETPAEEVKINQEEVKTEEVVEEPVEAEPAQEELIPAITFGDEGSLEPVDSEESENIEEVTSEETTQTVEEEEVEPAIEEVPIEEIVPAEEVIEEESPATESEEAVEDVPADVIIEEEDEDIDPWPVIYQPYGTSVDTNSINTEAFYCWPKTPDIDIHTHENDEDIDESLFNVYVAMEQQVDNSDKIEYWFARITYNYDTETWDYIEDEEERSVETEEEASEPEMQTTVEENPVSETGIDDTVQPNDSVPEEPAVNPLFDVNKEVTSEEAMEEAIAKVNEKPSASDMIEKD